MGNKYWSNKIRYRDAKHAIVDTAKFLYENFYELIRWDHSPQDHVDALVEISPRYTKDDFQKLVLIHSGFASAKGDTSVIIADAELLKRLSKQSKKPFYSSAKRTYQAYLSQILHSFAGETGCGCGGNYKQEACLEIVDNWSKLGLGKERLKGYLDKLVKIKLEGSLSGIKELANIYKRAGYSGEDLPEETQKKLTRLALSEIKGNHNPSNAFSILEFVGYKHFKVDKKSRKKLLGRGDYFLTKDWWFPWAANGIYELIENRNGGLDNGRKEIKEHLSEYLSNETRRGKRRIVKLIENVKRKETPTVPQGFGF